MVKENHRQYSYTWEKLHLAVLCLISDDEQWKRIRDAYTSIKIVRLEKEKFPPHLHDKYDELMGILEKYEEDFQNCSDRSEGSISFAARNMSEDERRKCCDIFISLYDSVTRYMPAD